MITILMLAQLSSGQVMVPAYLPDVLRGAWDLSAEACLDQGSLTRVEFGPNWMRDNLGLGLLQFYTSVSPRHDFDEALEARFIMGGDAGLRDQQVLLNLRGSRGKRTLSWVDSRGSGHIDEASQPIDLVECPDEGRQ